MAHHPTRRAATIRTARTSSPPRSSSAAAAGPPVGLDVLATKVAVDFQGLTSEAGDNCIKRNLEALREATGVDAICIALFDARAQAHRARGERHRRCSRRSTRRCMKGDSLERLPLLAGTASSTCASSRSATRSAPRREHAVDAARFAELNVRSAARLRLLAERPRLRLHRAVLVAAAPRAGTPTCTCC